MLWVKTAHVLFVIAWMAGIFYLPRILVHYVEATRTGEDPRRLVIMAEKLVRFAAIMGVLATAFGIWLWLGYDFSGNWLTTKLVFVTVFIPYHIQCYRYTRTLRQGAVIQSSLFFRIFNESALLILIPILILVIVKPI